ncbi:tyrosine-type recombinase/integrase [Citricoccus sp. I39-566]|uniref:tyrosine-type recombinase/integrase n=1 Tax=Citricoccus sp. I39-566 TaxID=3073268 RepID=UPI00286C91F9|nr:tyrosine-type recombinase/integrase [Citricoccus sp. I39-566]WMY79202.1 tyrosine-type recombinase/integrase [Citricoccus sp. I39-566]
MANSTGKRKPKMQPNGAGTLIQIQSPYGPRWRAVSTVEIGGKAVRVSGEGVTPSQAYQRRAKNIERRHQANTAGGGETVKARKTPELTARTMFRRWLDEIDADPDLADNAKKQYRNNLELHVIPHLGDEAAASLNKEAMRDHFSKTLPNKVYNPRAPDKRLGAGVMRNIHKNTKRALTWAVSEGLISTNPMTTVKAPKVRRSPVTIDQDTPRRILAHLADYPTQEELRWLLAFMGLRQSEALGLTWDKIDRFAGRITIDQQLGRKETFHGCGHRTGKKFPCGKASASACPQTIGTPGWEIKDGAKSEAGDRAIPMTPNMKKLFQKHSAEQQTKKSRKDWKPLDGLDNLVFTTDSGEPRKHNPDTAQWRKLLTAVGLPYQRGHISRHTTATLLARMKPEVPIGIVQEILGHNSAAMSEYYTHRGYESQREPLEALENVMRQPITYQEVKKTSDEIGENLQEVYQHFTDEERARTSRENLGADEKSQMDKLFRAHHERKQFLLDNPDQDEELRQTRARLSQNRGSQSKA